MLMSSVHHDYLSSTSWEEMAHDRDYLIQQYYQGTKTLECNRVAAVQRRGSRGPMPAYALSIYSIVGLTGKSTSL